MEQVPLGLPAAILPSVQAVLSPDCTSQFVRVQPNNLSSVQSGAFTIPNTATTAINTAIQIPFPATPIQFSVPAGASPNVFIDHSKSVLNFRVRYSNTASSAVYGGLEANLQGSAHAWFERCTEMINGAVIDDQTGWDVACNSDLAWALNSADRDVNAVSLGLLAENVSPPAASSASYNLVQGHAIPNLNVAAGAVNAGDSYFSYCIPFKSAFAGVDAKSFTPIGRCGKYDITLYPPSLAPVTLVQLAAAATAAGTNVTITIDQISLELFYITLDQQSAALLPSVDKPWALSGVTHRVGSGTLPSSTTGAVSIQVPIRVKSARSLSTRFSENVRTITNGAVNGKFDSKAPLVSSMSYFLAGQKRVPNMPHSTQLNISRIFAHTMQAYYDKGIDRQMSRCAYAPSDFCKYMASAAAPTAAAQYDQFLVAAGSDSLVDSLSGFEFAEDLRLASTTFLNGSDLTSSNSYLEFSLLSAPTNTQNVVFIAKADIIFVIMPNGNVEARV
jgi:hypothetical protein